MYPKVYLLLLHIGLLMAPLQMNAYGGSSCCDSNLKFTKEKGDSKESSHSSKCCSKKNKSTSCRCTPNSVVSILPDLLTLATDKIFTIINQNKLFKVEADISDGFYCIWIPPNIK